MKIQIFDGDEFINTEVREEESDGSYPRQQWIKCPKCPIGLFDFMNLEVAEIDGAKMVAEIICTSCESVLRFNMKCYFFELDCEGDTSE